MIDLFVKEGVFFDLEDVGNFFCMVVVKGDFDFFKRLFLSGMDLNIEDYDYRILFYVVVLEGLFLMVKMFVEVGVSVVVKDW